MLRLFVFKSQNKQKKKTDEADKKFLLLISIYHELFIDKQQVYFYAVIRYI